MTGTAKGGRAGKDANLRKRVAEALLAANVPK